MSTVWVLHISYDDAGYTQSIHQSEAGARAELEDIATRYVEDLAESAPTGDPVDYFERSFGVEIDEFEVQP